MRLIFPTIRIVYNRRHRATATHPVPPDLFIQYKGRQKIISVGVPCVPKEWDAKNGRYQNRVDAIELNKLLDKYINDVRKVIYKMDEEGSIDISAIPARLEALRNPIVDFLDFCARKAEIRKYGKAADSQERYDRFLRFLKEYNKIRSFTDLTEFKVMELDRHLKKQNNMKPKSRWNNYHRFLNSFILDAKKEGLIQRNPYDSVKIDHGDDSDGIDKFLYPEEFAQLRSAKMPNERLEKVRDLFVFQTLTCLSYGDLTAFRMDKLKEVDLAQVLAGRRGKTNVEYMVPLLPDASEILKKYNGLPRFQKNKILTNQKYNDYLKEVMKETGIDRPVTTHWARHTGATLLLNLKVPLQVVSKVCGHSSIKMTERIYAKLLDRTVVQEVLAVKDKI